MKEIAKTNLLDIKSPTGRIRSFSTRRDATDHLLPYSGFNVCDYTGDSPEHIGRCRQQLAAELGIPADNLIIPRQSHSSQIAVIESAPVDPQQLENIDGLVTRREDIALCINTADCVPIVLADPAAGVIGAVHSGWRGTISRIVSRAVDEMVRLGADARQIIAATGPAICPDCFEVGEEVADQFRREFGPATVDNRLPRPHVDLARAIAISLTDSGVQRQNIHLSRACSHCSPADYFSARRLGIASGRTLSLILRQKPTIG